CAPTPSNGSTASPAFAAESLPPAVELFRPNERALNLLQPRRAAELAEQRSRGGFLAVFIEQDLAIAERQRLAGDDQAHPVAAAFELKGQSARRIFHDLFPDLAH